MPEKANAGEGKLLVSVLATILCVRKGTSCTQPGLTSLRTKCQWISMWRENLRNEREHHGNTGQIVLINFSSSKLRTTVTKIGQSLAQIHDFSQACAFPGVLLFGFHEKQKERKKELNQAAHSGTECQRRWKSGAELLLPSSLERRVLGFICVRRSRIS